MPTVDQTLNERGSRYGDFSTHADIAQDLQDVMRRTPGWTRLRPMHKQALTVFADKVARILNGDPDYADNWHDIQGYAKLVEDRLPKPEKVWSAELAGCVPSMLRRESEALRAEAAAYKAGSKAALESASYEELMRAAINKKNAAIEDFERSGKPVDPHTKCQSNGEALLNMEVIFDSGGNAIGLRSTKSPTPDVQMPRAEYEAASYDELTAKMREAIEDARLRFGERSGSTTGRPYDVPRPPFTPRA